MVAAGDASGDGLAVIVHGVGEFDEAGDQRVGQSAHTEMVPVRDVAGRWGMCGLPRSRAVAPEFGNGGLF